MAEIDTAAPFASVRDAIYMFGEHSTEKIQRAFLSTHELQLEKIHYLKVELHQLQEKHMDTINQLSIAQSSASNAFKELAETKNVLQEIKQNEENDALSKNLVLGLQLEAMREQEKQRLQELVWNREEIKNLHEKLKYLDYQFQTTLDTLNKAQEENQNLQDEINKIMSKHEECTKEQDNIAMERMKGLLEDLFTTKEMLAKAKVAHANIEEDFRIFRIRDLERVEEEEYNSSIEIENMKNKLQDAEDKQEEIILVVEKLKGELIVAKEAERKALQVEVNANVNLEMMKVEVEESKVAKEKVKVLLIQLDDMNSKLEIFAQEEQKLLASLASLKLVLENTNEKLCIIEDEAKEKTIEMEDHINQLQVDLNVALMEKAEIKECVSNLNEALQQVTVEAIEAKATTTQAIEELVVKTQELQEALLHNQTLECRLQATMKEIEAIKASEVFALTEVKFFKKKANKNIDANENRQDVTISYDEYKTMTKRIVDSEDVANKRIAAALAQVDASKASEFEISKKLESVKNLLEKSQKAVKQAVQVAEIAEAAKFVVEGELRKWRLENEQRRKASVAAIMAIGNNGVVKNCGPLAPRNNLCDEKMTSTDESNRRSLNGSPNILKPKQCLAQIMRYNFSKDEKNKTKQSFSRKMSSYFNKKIK